MRELENAIERAVVLGNSDWILPEDLPETIWETQPVSSFELPHFHATLREEKKEMIRKAFVQAKGSFTETVKILGIHPNYLHRLVRNLDLKSSLEKTVKRHTRAYTA